MIQTSTLPISYSLIRKLCDELLNKNCLQGFVAQDDNRRYWYVYGKPPKYRSGFWEIADDDTYPVFSLLKSNERMLNNTFIEIKCLFEWADFGSMEASVINRSAIQSEKLLALPPLWQLSDLKGMENRPSVPPPISMADHAVETKIAAWSASLDRANKFIP